MSLLQVKDEAAFHSNPQNPGRGDLKWNTQSTWGEAAFGSAEKMQSLAIKVKCYRDTEHKSEPRNNNG